MFKVYTYSCAKLAWLVSMVLIGVGRKHGNITLSLLKLRYKIVELRGLQRKKLVIQCI